MAITYFGNNVDGATANHLDDITRWNDPAIIAYTCPGVGKQDVKELGARIYNIATGPIRLAIYTTAGAFVTQGSATLDTSTVDDNWLSHTSFVDQSLTPHSPQLDGGDDYIIAICGHTANTYVWATNVTSGDTHINASGDKTGGMDATLPAATANTVHHSVRCGVEPAAGGGVTFGNDILIGFGGT